MNLSVFIQTFVSSPSLRSHRSHLPRICHNHWQPFSSNNSFSPYSRLPRRYLNSRSQQSLQTNLPRAKAYSNTSSLRSQTGTIALCAANIALYAADHWAKWPLIAQTLYLHHGRMRWFQLLTSLFCHGSWTHLSSNLFFLLVFGRLVEEEAGVFGVAFTYLFCGALANLLVISLIPSATSATAGVVTVSLGASGSVFALFILAILTRFRFTIVRVVETFVMGAFVLERVKEEVGMITSGNGKVVGGLRVNHWVHLGGALAGAFLVVMVRWVVRQGKLKEEADLKGKQLRER